MRKTAIERTTKETQIKLELNLDGTRTITIDTKIPFFDHMLTLFAFHGGFDLTIDAFGDIDVDDHHTVEDVGILLGQALTQVLGNKQGIERYASSVVPMDESLARVSLDLSNRSYLNYQVSLCREKLGTMDTQNVKEFFMALTREARLTLHIELLYGENDHHKIEAIFKAFGRALRDAVRVNNDIVPSSKGVL